MYSMLTTKNSEMSLPLVDGGSHGLDTPITLNTSPDSSFAQYLQVTEVSDKQFKLAFDGKATEAQSGTVTLTLSNSKGLSKEYSM